MLILERRLDEAVVIGDTIKVMVVAIRDNRVRLGITAPKNIPVHREEVQKKLNDNSNEVSRMTVDGVKENTGEKTR